MTKDEYFMLLGKQKHAMDELLKASRESRRVHDALQSWLNGLQINKMDEQKAANGHSLIDQLFKSKQLEAYWKAEEIHAKQALNGQANPPTE